jgi:hypothetical protein
MPKKPDQTVIETAFQDPEELAAMAEAARSAASAPKDEDKTEDMRPLRKTKAPTESVTEGRTATGRPAEW